MDLYEKEVLDKLSKILDDEKGMYPFSKIDKIKCIIEAFDRSDKIRYSTFISKNKRYRVDWRGNMIGRVNYPKNPVKKWLSKKFKYFSDRWAYNVKK